MVRVFTYLKNLCSNDCKPIELSHNDTSKFVWARNRSANDNLISFDVSRKSLKVVNFKW